MAAFAKGIGIPLLHRPVQPVGPVIPVKIDHNAGKAIGNGLFLGFAFAQRGFQLVFFNEIWFIRHILSP